MVILTDQLRELLVHLSFRLRLYLSESVRDNSNQKIKHDHNQEDGRKSEHQVNYCVTSLSKIVSIKVTQHQLEHLHERLDVRALCENLLAILLGLVVLSKNEESA